jgi:hypothetical protein
MNNKFMSIGIVLIFLIIGLSGCSEISSNMKLSITSFEVNPSIINAGDTANLSWIILGAETVSIDKGIGNVAKTGSRIIQPTTTTTYTLTASNGTDSKTASTQIIVNKNGDDTQEEPPNIQFVKDTTNHKLTVASVDPKNLMWSNFEITGVCDTSNLGSTVEAGDYLSSCSGIISIRHIPTNTLIGTWEFQ